MNNKLKRITTLLLSLMLVFGMISATALAAPIWDTRTSGSLTITKTDSNKTPLEGAEYTIYKVADITQTSDASGVKMSYTNVVGDLTIKSTTKASDFEAYLSSLTPAGKKETLAENDCTIKFEGLALGVYVVVETKTPDGVIASNNFLVSIPMSTNLENTNPTPENPILANTWNYDVVAKPKNSVTDAAISKTVVGTGTPTGTETDPVYQSVSIGEIAKYTITAKLPTDFDDADKIYKQLDIVDTPDAALDIKLDTIKVMAGAAELAAGTDYVLVPGTPTGGFTVQLIQWAQDETNEEDEGTATYSSALTAGAIVTVTYDATLKSTVTPGVAVKNKASLIYDYKGSKGPGEVPTDPDPELYTYSYALKKVDEKNAILPEAKFVIQNAAGKYLKIVDSKWVEAAGVTDAYVAKSGTDGLVSFIGLAEGEYKITEIEAPSGYSLLKEPIIVKINAASTAAQQIIGGSSQAVVNAPSSQFELPATGGMGIYLFTIVGVVLMTASIIIYFRIKKRSSSKATN